MKAIPLEIVKDKYIYVSKKKILQSIDPKDYPRLEKEPSNHSFSVPITFKYIKDYQTAQDTPSTIQTII